MIAKPGVAGEHAPAARAAPCAIAQPLGGSEPASAKHMIRALVKLAGLRLGQDAREKLAQPAEGVQEVHATPAMSRAGMPVSFSSSTASGSEGICFPFTMSDRSPGEIPK
ncbi:MAG: hypothetical protein NUV34_02430 [Sulfuricaulis sp.]|nr:hypothetical protein [Sulfuricaulis sp.]